jgi:hypothetical protein
MNEQTKLLLALQQIDNLTSLLENNKYQQYLYGHLTQIRIELQRQYNNLL